MTSKQSHFDSEKPFLFSNFLFSNVILWGGNWHEGNWHLKKNPLNIQKVRKLFVTLSFEPFNDTDMAGKGRRLIMLPHIRFYTLNIRIPATTVLFRKSKQRNYFSKIKSIYYHNNFTEFLLIKKKNT